MTSTPSLSQPVDHKSLAPHITIGISSCLLGEKVRFDGGHKHQSYITETLGQYFGYRAFCPEVDIGLGIPRPTIKLIATDADNIICVDSKTQTQDYTQALTESAHKQREWHQELCGYIFKKDSPSCGMERVKVQQDTQVERRGQGIYAAAFMHSFPLTPTEEEGRLGDAGLRENFVQRVYIYHRWKQLQHAGISRDSLFKFHSQHKLILMSHNQNTARDLGRLLAQADNQPLQSLAETYIEQLMQAIKKPASRGNHVNVLQHIQGYLKKHLSADDKLELKETIDQYRLGFLPLIVPITLLRHHFRNQKDPFIEQSWYMHPYPAEMMLLNGI